MHVIFLFGFMLPVAAIRIWKPVTGVDWKMALLTCSANDSRLPRVRVNNNGLELVDDIASNISNIFWLGAVYETIQINHFNVSDDDLGFPGVCCGAFPAFSNTCIQSCISCTETHQYKCKISQQSDFPGVGRWIVATRLCSLSTLTRGDKDDKYWNHDIHRLSLNLTTSGQEKATCTYFCAGSVHIRECSNSLGVDTICVTDEVENSYPSSTSNVSTHVSTDVGNSRLEYTDGTLPTHFSTNTEESTEDSKGIRYQMSDGSLSTKSIANNETSTDDSTRKQTHTTEGSDDQRSTSQLTSASFAFTNSTTKSHTHKYAASSTISQGTFNPHVTSMSMQVTTSSISTSNTGNTLTITKDDRYVFITLIVVMATVLIAFIVVLFMYCRLRRTSLKSHKSETNMTNTLLFPDSNRLNPIYGADHDFVVNGDPYSDVGYIDTDYYAVSDVSALPTGASNREINVPPGSEQLSKVRGSMNTDIYARPVKVPKARSSSRENKEVKRINENAGGDSAIYAFPSKVGKYRKYSNDADGTFHTLDHRSMENVQDNVSDSEINVPPGSEQLSKLRGSMNTDIYARPVKVPKARSPSRENKEVKRINENAGGDSAIYAFPSKVVKYRKYSNDADGTFHTLDHRSMDNVQDNVSKSRLSGKINETSEGDYEITDFSGRTLENGTSLNMYDATNFPFLRPSAGINTYL